MERQTEGCSQLLGKLLAWKLAGTHVPLETTILEPLDKILSGLPERGWIEKQKADFAWSFDRNWTHRDQYSRCRTDVHVCPGQTGDRPGDRPGGLSYMLSPT